MTTRTGVPDPTLAAACALVLLAGRHDPNALLDYLDTLGRPTPEDDLLMAVLLVAGGLLEGDVQRDRLHALAAYLHLHDETAAVATP